MKINIGKIIGHTIVPLAISIAVLFGYVVGRQGRAYDMECSDNWGKVFIHCPVPIANATHIRWVLGGGQYLTWQLKDNPEEVKPSKKK